MPIVDSHQKVAREDRSARGSRTALPARNEVSHSVDLAGRALTGFARLRLGDLPSVGLSLPARIEVSRSVDLAGLPARARARVGRAVRGMRFERMDPYGSGS